MENIKEHIKNTYNLSNYQLAQLIFLVKTLSSEISKILIMGIIFHKHLSLYLFALFIMLCLRCSTGGLHFYTYAGCLLASTLYLGTALIPLPYISLSRWIQILLLLGCILICYTVGPVTSKYRPAFSSKHKKHCKLTSCILIFFYTIILYIMPENIYLVIGFWIIILHSLQLIVAKIQKKGVVIKCFPSY